MALCREGALVRTGQAHAHGRGASGCGFRCRKRPGRESTVPPRPSSSLERTLARAPWRALIELSRVLRQLFHEVVRHVAHLRSEAENFSTQVAV